VLLFFHPAVWWIENQLSLEREMACDGAVLAATANPRVYARCLLSLAERDFGRPGVTLAQAAVNRLHQLSARIKQVLDDNRVPGTRIAKPAVAGAAVLSAIGFVALSRAPQIVQFEDVQPVAHALNDSHALAERSASSPVIRASFSDRQTPARASLSAPSASTQSRTSKSMESLDTSQETSFASAHSSRQPLQASFRQPRFPQKGTPAAGKLSSRRSEVLFLMRATRQYDASGAASSWSVQIVQLTVFHPVVTPTVKQNPPKSI
jgi:BlaR1 peptidase M56